MAEPTIRDISTVFGFWASRQIDVSLQALSQILNKHGIARAATLSTVGIFVDSRRGNDLTWQAAQADPRLLPAGTVDPRGGAGCLEEFAERVEQGFRMFALFPETQSWSLDHACFLEILKCAGQAGVPVLIETGRAGCATVVARAAEQAGARVILSHIGYRNLGEALMVMKGNSNVFLETHLLTSTDGIERAADEVGSERLLFGSGAPLQYFSSAYLRLRFADLAEGDKAAILSGNFARLLEAA